MLASTDEVIPLDLMLLFEVSPRLPQDGVLKDVGSHLPYGASATADAGHKTGSVLA